MKDGKWTRQAFSARRRDFIATADASKAVTNQGSMLPPPHEPPVLGGGVVVVVGFFKLGVKIELVPIPRSKELPVSATKIELDTNMP